MKSSRSIALLALAAAVVGLVFALISTSDFTAHLDRQIHDLHCSFIPGAAATSEGSAGCKAALFSAYSSLFRETYWGGVPISLFAVGAYSFFIAFCIYLLVAREHTPRVAWWFLGTIGFSPLVVSLAMFGISLFELGTFCKVCVGMYLASAALAVAAAFALRHVRAMGVASGSQPSANVDSPAAPRLGGPLLFPVWLGLIGLSALLPAVVYARSLPDYTPYVTKCGKLEVTKESHNALVKLPTKNPLRPVVLFEDPLCPTCKAFHERLVADGIFDRFDVTLVLFPLDDEDGHCNWMVGQSLHPGACILSRGVLCGGSRSREVLEWAYANQEDLRLLGKTNPKGLKDRVVARFGHELGACVEDPKTTQRLNQHLRFAASNHVPVSTPQVFIGDQRLCDEDTDLGLRYALSRLAPEVLR